MRPQHADSMESCLETAFQPGRHIEDRACFDFVHDLEEVSASIDDLAASDPTRADALYELVLAGCHHKADQLDDSLGYFGMFAKSVICRWIRARQKSAEDPAATFTTLLSCVVRGIRSARDCGFRGGHPRAACGTSSTWRLRWP